MKTLPRIVLVMFLMAVRPQASLAGEPPCKDLQVARAADCDLVMVVLTFARPFIPEEDKDRYSILRVDYSSGKMPIAFLDRLTVEEPVSRPWWRRPPQDPAQKALEIADAQSKGSGWCGLGKKIIHDLSNGISYEAEAVHADLKHDAAWPLWWKLMCPHGIENAKQRKQRGEEARASLRSMKDDNEKKLEGYSVEQMEAEIVRWRTSRDASRNDTIKKLGSDPFEKFDKEWSAHLDSLLQAKREARRRGGNKP